MLEQRHHDELRASGLSDETIEAAGIHSVSNTTIAEVLRWQPKQHDWGTGYVIPYPGSNGDAQFVRIKLDFPRHAESGKAIKYESPIRSNARAYIPSAVLEALKAQSREVVIVEGEKKCLCVNQYGWACVGLGGVWAWQQARPRTEGGKAYGRRVLIEDLKRITWTGRPVVIVFDSDAAENPLVRMAEFRLSEALIKQGATVRVARISQDGDSKIGADDYLVAHGADAFRKILDAATKAEEPPTPSLMDLARSYIGDRFTGKQGRTLISWRGEFYRHTRTHYVKTPADEIRADVIRWLDQNGFKAAPRTARDIAECVAAEVMVIGETEQPIYLDDRTQPLWLPMSNGILDVQAAIDGKPDPLRKHTPRYFTLFGLPYRFDSAATCDLWFEKLNEVFEGDTERLDLLGEWFGYCLTCDTRHQAILLCEGPPRSGKGLVLRALRYVVGADNCCSPRLSSLAELFGLWGLIGKRAAICPDAHLGSGDKALSTLETLKLISGEDPVEIHRKNLPPITTRLRIKFALACNELPKFGDGANALATRVVILSFRKSFAGTEDRTLEPRIEAEAPGILRWSLEGLGRLQAQGRFTKPSIAAEVEQDFARLVNPLRAYLDERCIVGPTETVSRAALWEDWKLWCDYTNHLPGSIDRLGARLRVLIPYLDTTRPRTTDGRTRMYVGVGLSSEVEALPNA